MRAKHVRNAISTGTRANRIANMNWRIRFEKLESFSPYDHGKLRHKAATRMAELEYFWDRLDVYHRHAPIRAGHSPWNTSSGELLDVVSPHSTDMLLHSSSHYMQQMIRELRPDYMQDRSRTWCSKKEWGLDMVFTLYAYCCSRHWNAKFPNHPGGFTDYGSVPLRAGDHEIIRLTGTGPILPDRVPISRYGGYPQAVSISATETLLLSPSASEIATRAVDVYRVDLRDRSQK